MKLHRCAGCGEFFTPAEREVHGYHPDCWEIHVLEEDAADLDLGDRRHWVAYQRDLEGGCLPADNDGEEA